MSVENTKIIKLTKIRLTPVFQALNPRIQPLNLLGLIIVKITYYTRNNKQPYPNQKDLKFFARNSNCCRWAYRQIAGIKSYFSFHAFSTCTWGIIVSAVIIPVQDFLIYSKIGYRTTFHKAGYPQHCKT